MERGDGEGFAASLSVVVYDARPAASLEHLPIRGASRSTRRCSGNSRETNSAGER